MKPAKRLGRIWGDSLALQVHGTQFILRLRKSLERSLVIEAQRLGKVTGSSLAIAIHKGYAVLGNCQPLRSSFGHPGKSGTVAAVDSVPGVIEVSQVVFCRGVALLGSQTIPFGGLGKILEHAHAILVHVAQSVLGLGMPLQGGVAPPLRGGGRVFRHKWAAGAAGSPQEVLCFGFAGVSTRFKVLHLLRIKNQHLRLAWARRSDVVRRNGMSAQGDKDQEEKSNNCGFHDSTTAVG